MEAGDIIYVIVLVGVAISSIVKHFVKKNPEQQNESSHTPQPTKQDIWGELIREIQQNPEPTPVGDETEIIVAQPIHRDSQEIIWDERINKPAEERKQTKSTQTKHPLQDDLIKEAEIQNQDDTLDLFSNEADLKKAIIYSEILKPKYQE